VPVAVACRVLKLSTQGYYKWLQDPVSQRDWDDAHLIHAAREIHQDDPTLGYRFLPDELADVGIVASENRVWRLCSTAGIFASHARKKSKAGKPGPPVHDDLLAVIDDKGRVRHDFTATAPNQTGLTDISEHPTREGKLYLCAVKDCYSNKIVGYSIDSRMKASIAVSALRNAIGLRDPAGTIVHSDRGSQGGFNWSSQHLVIVEVFDGSSAAGSGSCDAGEDEVAGSSEVPASCRGRILGADRLRLVARGSRGRGRRGVGGRSTVVPQRWRHAAI
jgi:putative transposase